MEASERRSLKGQKSSDPSDFHLTGKTEEGEVEGRGGLKATGKHKGGETIKNANDLRPGSNDKGIKTEKTNKRRSEGKFSK